MSDDLTPQQAQLLLEKLSTDDAFRATLSVDPAAALKSVGLPTTLAACMQTSQTLPSKQTAQKALSAQSKQTASLMSMNVFNLKAD